MASAAPAAMPQHHHHQHQQVAVGGGGQGESAHKNSQNLMPDIARVEPAAAEQFKRAWRRLEERLHAATPAVRGVRSPPAFVVPREIVWLNGAPGSGKGTNSAFIMQARGFTRAPIEMSHLLRKNPDAQDKVRKGQLLDDEDVLDYLLEALFAPREERAADAASGMLPDDGGEAGVIIDGFPRTSTQVDHIKLLHEKLEELHQEAVAADPLNVHFPRPIFRILVLYVSEEESVRRQLERGRKAEYHRGILKDAKLVPEDGGAPGGSAALGVEYSQPRATDMSQEAARKRYCIFREHYHTLLRLRRYFHFTMINAMGSLAQCEAQIARELRYQSKLELHAEVYDRVTRIPLAQSVVENARSQLLSRLNSYRHTHAETFSTVIRTIQAEVVPHIKRCAIAGVAVWETTDPLFDAHDGEAIDMVLDVLSERGYGVTYREVETYIPDRVDLATGEIATRAEKHHLFRVTFERPKIRTHAAPAPTEEVPLELLRTDERLMDASAKMVVTAVPQYGDEQEGGGAQGGGARRGSASGESSPPDGGEAGSRGGGGAGVPGGGGPSPAPPARPTQQ